MQTINLSQMNLKEKIGQLVIVKPIGLNKDYLIELHVGGIFLNSLDSQQDYMEAIEFYQDNSKIKLLVATDMEGYWNPFNFYKSPNFGEISDEQDAYDLGLEHGKILSETGFNLDFSPVVETRNSVWLGRSFTGTPEEIKKKISAYIEGLQKQNISATAKHYPGGSLIKNPHLLKFKTEIFQQDLDYFDFAIEKNVGAIMVGHPIVYGVVNSNKKQASVSKEIIMPLREKFQGLIITDAVTMLGLRLSYPFNFRKIYPELIRAGNDIVLDTHKNSGYNAIKRRMNELERQAEKDSYLRQRIDESVKKILEKKGYSVVN